MTSGPSKVYIIRHGEKLGLPDTTDHAADPNFANTGPHLSARGSARATALPSLFTPRTQELSVALEPADSSFTAKYSRVGFAGMGPRLVPPDIVIAAKSSAHSYRPVETATPTAASLGLEAETEYDTSESVKLAQHVRTHDRCTGKVVLICWHHTQIPDLARALGLADPLPWPGTVFDRLWLLDYRTDPPGFTDCPQALLFGDSTT